MEQLTHTEYVKQIHGDQDIRGVPVVNYEGIPEPENGWVQSWLEKFNVNWNEKIKKVLNHDSDPITIGQYNDLQQKVHAMNKNMVALVPDHATEVPPYLEFGKKFGTIKTGSIVKKPEDIMVADGQSDFHKMAKVFKDFISLVVTNIQTKAEKGGDWQKMSNWGEIQKFYRNHKKFLDSFLHENFSKILEDDSRLGSPLVLDNILELMNIYAEQLKPFAREHFGIKLS